MKPRNLFLFIAAGLILSAPAEFAQQRGGTGAMMGGAPDDIKTMMQEPNKAMAQASVLYMTVFTKSLHTQSTERRDKIDSHYIKAAFAEMQRAHNMIGSFQAAHVKTMDAEMKEKVKMMMMRMNTNLADNPEASRRPRKVTGAEALYADLGHFGKKPIRVAWFCVPFPALLINYFGQGSLLLARGDEVRDNPFFELAPVWALYPLVVIATAAAVIASQALISGAYSLMQQAIQLGFWPRLSIVHTSRKASGQIYLPEVNWTLMVACIALTIGFRGSSALAAVSGTLFSVFRAARLAPAEGMRPETPTAYRTTLLERIGLQRWLAAPSRMILRHIERRPVKSLLTVLGIACACGLMIGPGERRTQGRYPGGPGDPGARSCPGGGL